LYTFTGQGLELAAHECSGDFLGLDGVEQKGALSIFQVNCHAILSFRGSEFAGLRTGFAA
jgi:hypothetical protein